MYDEKLEQLIDAALADGELTEKEKQILFKKAQTMGVDLDEFEMVLDARLVKLQKAEAEKTASSAPKSDKFGDVKNVPLAVRLCKATKAFVPNADMRLRILNLLILQKNCLINSRKLMKNTTTRQ